MDTRVGERLAAIDAELSAAYGEPLRRTGGDPLGGLIRAMLSQHTSDLNSGRAYRALRARFETWGAVRDAQAEEVEAAIRPGGLARTKGQRIQRLLAELAPEGEPSLEHIKEMPDGEAEVYLLGFHGAGLKTARCVLLFELGRDVFPMDTHILRVLRRAGLVEERESAEAAHGKAGAAIPRGRAYALHVNLIRHGRRRCKPRKPGCGECPIRSLCDYGRGQGA